MNYFDVQQQLRNKADHWEVHAMKSEISSLRNDNRVLSESLGSQRGELSNLRYAIDRLITVLTESGIKELEDRIGELHQINQF